ncbi:hypothetical protein FN846DRAFT_176708 [Sphaerosporella brunnea]|uniref:Uncharacterized protein n=1 Tax=Sphaerosporella brunnea TaxID=1250544 RepID=A0A5J5EQM2_9PEZI|nr:hypothetical protein FN846DRAFT_176708 [Sphaerosporella brunnea]
MAFNIVCPSSRGLSLALSRQLLLKTSLPLVATARTDLAGVKARILENLPQPVPEERVTVLRVDVTDEPTLSSAATQIRSLFPRQNAKYIFSTAGVLHPERSPQQLSTANITHTLHTNVLGPLLVLKHFSQFLPRQEGERGEGEGGGGEEEGINIWANVSARLGSISDNRRGGWYSYRASKAAVNSITKTFDLHLQQQKCGDGAMCVALHPGTVKTQLSREFWGSVEKEGKLFKPEFAAERLLDVVMRLKKEDRGCCWDWKGERIEW